jgi:hypothetical protein
MHSLRLVWWRWRRRCAYHRLWSSISQYPVPISVNSTNPCSGTIGLTYTVPSLWRPRQNDGRIIVEISPDLPLDTFRDVLVHELAHVLQTLRRNYSRSDVLDYVEKPSKMTRRSPVTNTSSHFQSLMFEPEVYTILVEHSLSRAHLEWILNQRYTNTIISDLGRSDWCD